MTQWVPLKQVLAHVARCVRSEPLAKLLLMRKLADIPTRGYVIYWAGPPREGMEEPLSPDLWTFSYGEQAPPAQINWEDETATLTSCGHPHTPCKVFRIEIDWQAVVALWPEQKPSKRTSERSPLKRGRKRVHNREEILREAEDDWNEHGAAASLEAWYLRVANRLEDKWPDRPRPERSFMMELLSPIYQSANIR